MTTKVNLPKLGMGIEEGTVVRWLKAEGERVEQCEPIVEIKTAKATQELEAPVSCLAREQAVAARHGI